MNISYNWLKKYIDIPYSPEELVEKLTMAGIEVESVSKANVIPDGIVVAEVIDRKPHPNADKLSVCTVDTGLEKLQVVCGAPNCNSGTKFAFAAIGTVFEDNGKKFKIKKTKLRGVESYGMLCSSAELGLNEDHSGIMELPDDLKTGTPLSRILKSDTVYELEITSNRPDWLSFIGIAREIKALSGNEIKFPQTNLPSVKNDKDYNNLVEIKNFELCPRYSARVIRNVTVKESPEWMKQALLSIGLRPINNIVDISNYVLFETGQPLHIFDLDELEENRIIVRQAEKNEKIVVLDGREYKLSEDNLVIADAQKPVCIAGVMGGEHSGVTGKTKNILIECAYFNPSSIRATSKKLELNSDSSHRFERGVDVSNIRYVSDRTASLVLELAGGELCSEFVDVKDESFFNKPKKVKCRFDRIRTFLGVEIAADVIIKILQRLDLKVQNITENTFEVVATTFRLDIEREADIAEEIIRIYGLDKVPTIEVNAIPGGSIKNDSYAVLANAREQLVSLGLTECINYTLTDKVLALRDRTLEGSDLVAVFNPISSESSILRPSLLSGVLKNVERNISRDTHDIKIFEVGKIYTANKKYPEERYSCCIALTGRKHPERYSNEKKVLFDFYDIKGLIDTWFEKRGIEIQAYKKSANPVFKSGLCADVLVDGRELATFGEISEEFTKGFRLKAPLYIAIIEFGELIKIGTKTVEYSPIPQFPSTTRDVAVVVDEKMENSIIISCIKDSKCKILEKVDVLDIYHDNSLGENKKSIAYSLTFRNQNRTLTDKEVNKAHEMIRSKLVKELQLTLR